MATMRERDGMTSTMTATWKVIGAALIGLAGTPGCYEEYCDGTVRVYDYSEFPFRLGPCDGPDDCEPRTGADRFDCADVGAVCASAGNEAACVASLSESCAPGAARCRDDGVVQRCDERFGLWSTGDSCRDGSVCVESGDSAGCVHPDRMPCVSGESGCAADGSVALSCDGTLGYMAHAAGPPDPGLVCVAVAGQSVWVVGPARPCTSASHVPYCWDDDQIVLCGDSGFAELAACPTGAECVLAENGASGCWGFPAGRPE